jgi:hypothetical protein
MIRASVLSLWLLPLLLPACAGSQSALAFTPRPAAAATLDVTAPNQSVARGHDLATSLDRTLAAEEDRDRADLQPGMPPVAPPQDALRAERPGVAPLAAVR